VIPPLPPLYPILDSGYLPRSGPARHAAIQKLIPQLIEAGVELLQYRNKQGSEAEILADARILRASAGLKLKLILNDWPALAVQAGFDGVHVGQQDQPPREARRIVGSDRIVGVSTHSPIQLRAAGAEPADYLAIGPVYATASKANPDPVIGLEGVRLARSLTSKPLVAVGGITLATAAQVRDAGADSIAVISAIFSPEGDSARASAAFLAALR
jgi:thiamine-phosphate pyrophosphorylase